MKVIDGSGAVMGRLASFVAKETMKGEEVVIINCDKVIITGNRKNIKAEFEESKTKIGSGQKGPKISRSPHMIVKRSIRGMLPNFRRGRGKILYSKIKCYSGVPKEFEASKKIVGGKDVRARSIPVGEIMK